jgi:hypothetical protein
MLVAFASEVTATATLRSVVVPSPSSPKKL